ncbi:MAG: quinone-dependent dihydroorotate dehydrogenase [Cytophagales bacterium]|nr:MAG: quinone-dependent dihydroorotate dehydrogenase [Cytophagales bacterium]TAF61082.1 MAG: quinone-dependent dihydroorotate dehydrogenase [Cytophagales bacterium]
MYKPVIRPLLFGLDAEKAHNLSLSALDIAHKLPLFETLLGVKSQWMHPSLERELMGLYFTNPLGLAAGLDKNGEHILGMQALGFGHIEVGTVTPRPQSGNPQPRLFRLKADRAIINRMGFNNKGVAALKLQLQKAKPHLDAVIGVNIGKNKDTPNENADQDYLFCFNELHEFADYFVVNVSSPNTPNLRELQDKEPLTKLLEKLQEANEKLSRKRPILLKIAPDLTEEQLSDIADIVHATKLRGVVATNTTIARSQLSTSIQTVQQIGAGGLSGQPVTQRSTQVIRQMRQMLGSGKVIVGVGGIMSAADALEKLDAGADLLQLYTGFVYEGPALITKILKAIKDDTDK